MPSAGRPANVGSEKRQLAHTARPDPAYERRCRIAALLVARRFEVTLQELAAPTRRSPATVRARQVAMYLAHVALGVPLASVGAGFGRDRTTASYACRRVEDKRDDPAFDSALAGLETAAEVAIACDGEERAA
jgi:hypothetical protein